MSPSSLARRAAILLAAGALALPAWPAPAWAELNGPAQLVRASYTDNRAPHQTFAWGTSPVPLGTWRDAMGSKHISRVYLTYDLRGYANSAVRTAILKVRELSGDCTRRAVEVWRTGATAADPTWSSAPAELAKIADLQQSDYACPSTLGADVASAFDAAVRAGEASITLELRVAAGVENKIAYGRTLDAAFSTPVTVFYNPKPSIDPTTLYANFKACATAAPLPYVSARSLELRARGVDADDEWSLLRYEYQLWTADDPAQVVTRTYGVFDGVVDRDGAVYSWRVRASDRVTTSDWSPTCSFVADLSAPSAAPTATSPAYDPDTTGWTGLTATFTFTANAVADVAGYQYTWSEFAAQACNIDAAGHIDCPPPLNYVDADAVGGSATVPITAPGPGSWSLQVRSFDRAGNHSAPLRLDVIVVLSGPPGVSSDVYTQGSQPSGGVGVTGTFIITRPSDAPPVVTYYYSVGDQSGEATPDSDGTATIGYTPTAAGSAVLNVFAYFGDDPNLEPQFSAPYDYAFTVAD